MIILILLIATAWLSTSPTGSTTPGNAIHIDRDRCPCRRPQFCHRCPEPSAPFLSVEVAVTGHDGGPCVQDSKTGHLLPGIDASMGLTIIFAGLIGGILWNLLTWLFGIPLEFLACIVRRSDRGRPGCTRTQGRQLARRHPEGAHPGLGRTRDAGVVAACGTWLVYRITRKVPAKRREDGFR